MEQHDRRSGNDIPDLPARHRAGRVVVGVFALVLLGGSAIATATITSAPPGVPRPEVPAAPIRGAAALRIDLVRAARWPFAGNAGFSVADDTGPAPPEPKPSPGGPHAANPAAGSEREALRLVAEFYDRLARDPGAALRALRAELVDGHRDVLVRTWSQVRWVRSSVREGPLGTVLADVEAGYPDGQRVVLSQLITVAPGDAPEITGVELLTARHFAR